MNNKIEQYLINQAIQKHTPIHVTFELTPRCNMNCEMCFIRLSKDQLNTQGKLLPLEKWIDISNSLQKAGTLFVLLTGGEPLLYDNFKEIYLTLHQMGMILTLNTNGTLIDEKMADFFMNHPPRRINITLYGTSNETYAKICHNPNGYTQTISAIKLLKERGIHVKLNGTIVPDNVNEIEQLYTIAQELDCPIEMETYLYPSHREREHTFNTSARLSPQEAGCAYIEESRLRFADKYNSYIHDVLNDIDTYKNRPQNLPPQPMLCHGGRSSAWINWKGEMSPCIFMNHISIDVLKNGFQNSWEYIRQCTQEIHLPQQCSNCDLRPGCSICPAMCYCEAGSFEQVPEYVCEYTKTIVDKMREECSR